MRPESAEIVTVMQKDTVAIVTLNFPERRNAFSLRMREALYAALYRLMHHEPAVRALVLAGAACTFCAGGDITEMQERTALQFRERTNLPLDIFRLMVAGPKPVVAAVEGNAYGAGLSLAAASDYVVAAADARFGCAFLKVGLLPDTGLFWSLAQRIGAARASDMMMRARELSGEAAAQIGLVNRITAKGNALEGALEVARRYAALPPMGQALLKAALATGAGTLEDALRSETDLQPLLRRSNEHLEAVAAFMEKRMPVFNGA